jgi:hypothetical protein
MGSLGRRVEGGVVVRSEAVRLVIGCDGGGSSSGGVVWVIRMGLSVGCRLMICCCCCGGGGGVV